MSLFFCSLEIILLVSYLLSPFFHLNFMWLLRDEIQVVNKVICQLISFRKWRWKLESPALLNDMGCRSQYCYYCFYLLTESCPTLLWPHGLYRLPGSSVHGILQARILERVAISSWRESSWPRDWICVSCTGRWILYHWVTWEALGPYIGTYQIHNTNFYF